MIDFLPDAYFQELSLALISKICMQSIILCQNSSFENKETLKTGQQKKTQDYFLSLSDSSVK